MEAGAKRGVTSGVEFIDFDAWYTNVRPKLVSSIAATGTTLETAEDAVDEALVKACERWDEVSVMANPDGWAYVVARNRLRTVQRREAVANRFRRFRHDEEALPDGMSEFQMLLAPLPLEQRHVLVMRHVFGMTEPEIATALGMTRGAVSSRLRRSHSALRSTLPALVALWGLR